MTRPSLDRISMAALCGLLSVICSAAPAFADSIRNRQWQLKSLDVFSAQRLTNGSGVTVAVIDTGVEAGHPDLLGNVLPGVDYNAGGTQGWVDTDGHGTAMAGLIAGHGHGPRGTDGVLGIAPGAKILPIRVLKSEGRATTDIPKAIDEAVRRHAGVISMSLGTTNTADLRAALARAIDADVILVASTGNRPDQIFVQYPARYPGVIAVGATARNGAVAPVSVTGKEVVLSAPGMDITTTSTSGAYETGDGTSASAAIVAGAAALVRAKFPNLSASEVVRRLTATATDKGPPGRDPSYGFGELDLLAALTADVPPLTAQPSVTSSGLPTPTAAAPEPAPAPALRVDWLALTALLAVIVVVIVLIVWLALWRRGRARPQHTPDQRGPTNRQGPFRGAGPDP